METVSSHEELKAYVSALKAGDEVTLVIAGDIIFSEDDQNQSMITILAGTKVKLIDDGQIRTFSYADKPVRMITVEEGAKLTIAETGDESAVLDTESGALIFDGASTTKAYAGSCGFFFTVYGEAELKGGTYQNLEFAANSMLVSAIFVQGENAYLKINGAKIRNNKFQGCYSSAPVLFYGLGGGEMNSGIITGNNASDIQNKITGEWLDKWEGPTSDLRWIVAYSAGGILQESQYVLNENGKYDFQTSEFTLNDGTITHNVGYFGGIGIHNDPIIPVNDIGRNFSEINNFKDHAMIFTMKKGTLHHNTATRMGGGIGGLGNMVVTIADCDIKNNIAAVGGGISLANLFYEVYGSSSVRPSPSYWAANYCDVIFTMENGVVDNNEAYIGMSEDANGDGGGIYLESYSAVIEKAEVTNNWAEHEGGGIFIPLSASAQVNSGVNISDNRAETRGGGIITGGVLALNGPFISGNEAGQNGGGMYINSYNDTTADGHTIFANNQAAGSGGGIYQALGNFKAVGMVVKNNEAGQNGGGIYTAAVCTLSGNVSISGNTAAAHADSDKGNGGGIYKTGASILKINNGVQIFQNTADDGGGLYIASNVTRLAISGAPEEEEEDPNPVAIFSNTARQDGGGIYTHDYEVLELAHVDFYRNAAQAGYLWELDEPPTEEDEINAAVHSRNVSHTQYTERFTNAYSNYDVNYKTSQEKKVHIVTFWRNDGTDAQHKLFIVPDAGAVGEVEKPIWSGQEFLGWHTSPEANELFDMELLASVTRSYDIYAKWDTGSYRVLYDKNAADAEGETTDINSPYTHGATVTVLENGFRRAGYTFRGWSKEPDGAVQYNPGDEFTIYSDTTLYAVWISNPYSSSKNKRSLNYQVIYHSEYETRSISETYQSGAAVTVKGEALFTDSEDMVFIGWSTSDGGAVVYQAGDTFLMPDRDVHLYAVYGMVLPPAGTEGMLNKEDHFAYIIGYPDGNVRPQTQITRAEAATIFFRLLTDEAREQYWAATNPFSDVNKGSWYHNAVSTLHNLKIVDGYQDGTFKPDMPITRAEIAVIAARFEAGFPEMQNPFTDISGHWAEADIIHAAAAGWATGYTDRSFRPDAYISRAEMMAIANRVLERHIESEHQMVEGAVLWPDNKSTEWYYYEVEEATNFHYYEKENEWEQWTSIRPVRDWTELEK